MQRYHGRSLESFVFLSERHVLLGLARRPLDHRELQALEIAEEPKLVVVDFLASNGEETKLEDADFVCAFHYPTMETRAVPLDISIRTDPAPNWKPHPTSQVPFYTANNDRLLVVTFTVYSPLEGHTQSLLFVRSATLMSHIGDLQTDSKHRFMWDDWGPSQTRMMRAPHAHDSVWVCYVFGLRFVTTRKKRGMPKWIEVYDFRPHAGDRRAVADPELDGEDDELPIEGRWMSEEMQMPEGIFGDNVTTSLPYLMRTLIPPRSENGKDWKIVMLSEDTIIVMKNVRVGSVPYLWLFYGSDHFPGGQRLAGDSPADVLSGDRAASYEEAVVLLQMGTSETRSAWHPYVLQCDCGGCMLEKAGVLPNVGMLRA